MMDNKAVENREAEADEISLKELILKLKSWISYLKSKWLWILILGVLGGVLGFVYANTQKPMYTAVTSFVLDDGGSGGGGLGQYAGIASMVGIDLGGGGGGIFQGDNIVELYKSNKMIQKTLLTEVENNGKKQLLIDSYIDFNDLRKQWSKENKALADLKFAAEAGKSFSRLQDSVLLHIIADINKTNLLVEKPDKKLSIIAVKVNAANEEFAKNFNEQLVKNVSDFYINTRTKKSLDNVAILQQKVDSVRGVMNGAIYRAAAVVDATPNLNPTRQVLIAAPVQKSQFTAETNKAILSELVKNLELSKISLRKETPLIQAIDEPIYPLAKKQFGRAKGIVIGGILFGFLACLGLIIGKLYKDIML